jgi:hypothetical protein
LFYKLANSPKTAIPLSGNGSEQFEFIQRLDLILHMQFLEDIFQVLFHRLPGNSHLFCNLFIQQPFGKQFQHFFFPLTQQGINAPGNRLLKPLK